MADRGADARRYEIKVLSLATATDRRERMTEMLSRSPLGPWSFFDALPASALTLRYDEIETYQKYGSVMSPAEISCAVSHIAIIEDFIASDLDYIVALEDDVLIDPAFDLAATIEAIDLLGIGYFKLYARHFVPATHLASFGRAQLYRFAWPPCGTQGYILSKAGARTMIASIKRRPGLEMPIDQLMDRYWETGVPIYMLYPFPLMELNVATSIHGPEQRRPLDERNRELAASQRRSWFDRKRTILGEKVKRRATDLSLRQADEVIVQTGRAYCDEITRLVVSPAKCSLAWLTAIVTRLTGGPISIPANSDLHCAFQS